ncbi:MAG: nucleotidyltransferase [Ginsengibacter sp.]
MKTIFDENFIDLIEILNKKKAKFVLVGGLAVVVHGVYRTTKDMDILFEGNEDNSQRVLEAINAFGFGSLNLTIADLMDTNGYIQLGNEPIRIDLFNSLPGVAFDEVYKNAFEHEEDDIKFKVIHINHLIQNKNTVGRLQDLDDVKKLKKILAKKEKKNK